MVNDLSPYTNVKVRNHSSDEQKRGENRKLQLRANARLLKVRLNLREFTQGGALTDSRLPWATIVRPLAPSRPLGRVLWTLRPL